VGAVLDIRIVVRVMVALLATQLLLTVLFLGGVVQFTFHMKLQNVKGSSIATLCV
jgi:hypothetical protein